MTPEDKKYKAELSMAKRNYPLNEYEMYSQAEATFNPPLLQKCYEDFIQQNINKGNSVSEFFAYLLRQVKSDIQKRNEGLEVQARVNFKLDELLTAMRNAAARNWVFAHKTLSQKYTYYWEAFEQMVQMLDKERYMAAPYDEMAIQNKRFKRDVAVEDIMKIIEPLVRGRNDRSSESITRAIVSIIKKAQKY